jgi:hypothetical protein
MKPRTWVLISYLAAGLTVSVASAAFVYTILPDAGWVNVVISIAIPLLSGMAAYLSILFARESLKASKAANAAEETRLTAQELRALTLAEHAYARLLAGDDENSVVVGVHAIESIADLILGPAPNNRRRSFFELRRELRDRGVWTDEDVRSFDVAVKVRNWLTHGDYRELSRGDERVARNNLTRLLGELNRLLGAITEARK